MRPSTLIGLGVLGVVGVLVYRHVTAGAAVATGGAAGLPSNAVKPGASSSAAGGKGLAGFLGTLEVQWSELVGQLIPSGLTPVEEGAGCLGADCLE